MLSFTQPLKGMAEFEEIEKSLEKNQGIVQITGCLESQKAHLIHGLSGKAPLRLVIAGDERQAKETFEDLRFYNKDTLFYPAKDLLFFQADIQGNLLIRQRMCVVKALLEQMHGSIAVTSEEGVGSTFVVTIPFDIAPEPQSGKTEPPHDATIEGLHFLLAEDNDLNAEIALALLTDQGAKVTVAKDGREALDTFCTEPAGTFDAVLMDVMMPVMDGLAVTRAIRALDRPDAKTIPIIAVTANAFAEDTEKCMEAGMNAHLAKPLDIQKLKQTVCEQMKNRK